MRKLHWTDPFSIYSAIIYIRRDFHLGAELSVLRERLVPPGLSGGTLELSSVSRMPFETVDTLAPIVRAEISMQ